MSKQLDDLFAQIRALEIQMQELRLTEAMKKLAAIKPKNKTRQILQLEEKLNSQLAMRKVRREAFDDLLDLIEIVTD
jgi:hypothetical protein